MKHIFQIILITVYFAQCAYANTPDDHTADYDVVVYGDSSGAVTAAISAKRQGYSVVLVNPTRFLGGMSASGLGATDFLSARATFGGIASEFYDAIAAAYDQDYVRSFEPHVGQEVFKKLIADGGVKVLFDEKLDREHGVKMDGQRIVSITTLSGKTFKGKMFIDATYVGDLMAAAGVTYTVGRESEDQYDETLAGVRRGDTHPRVHYTQGDKDHFIVDVDPYIKQGDFKSGLLPHVHQIDDLKNGQGDQKIQAYTYRLCLTTDPDLRIPIEKPVGYREIDHELLLRNFEAGDHRMPALIEKLAGSGSKVDWNHMHAIGSDFAGANWAYPEASYEDRRKIEADHELYIRGFLWTLSNSARVPEEIRKKTAAYGLPKDEFVSNGGWPYMIYIREARRMVSDYVMTQHNCESKVIAEDPVGLGSFGMDSHTVQHFVNEKGYVRHEGVIWRAKLKPYGISYRSIIPRKGECDNLLSPICLSASHVAHGSIRMEPVFMVVSESAALAAGLAIEDGISVQEVDYSQLRERLDANKQIVEILPQRKRVEQKKLKDSLPSLNMTPQNVEQLWAGYDPGSEPLDVQVVREWQKDDLTLRYVIYTIGTFKGKQAKMAAFYGFPTGRKNLPGVMHMHGGGQRAFMQIVKRYAKRGYATISVNWGGRIMEDALVDDPNTDWGAVDPTQNNVGGYSNLLPEENTIDPFPSARNNNWFLLTIGCRRGITFLEQQPEVDAHRIGVFGHSMGGRLTGLVAGIDERVKAASPSVGGSGFLQTDLWGLPGSARRVKGDVDLFQRTIAGQAYLARIRCPILYLSASNDFNAPMDFVEQGMGLVPHENKRTTYAPHLNHRFTPETEIARPLWFDAQLQQRFQFPKSPEAELILNQRNGIPIFRVKPDTSMPIERVDVYYGYERDPRNRFWSDGLVEEEGGVWEVECPVFDLDEPLFVFANVYYRLGERERRMGDPEMFALSVSRAAYPDALRGAKVKATEEQHRLIDDFARGFHDWYSLNANNRHHWLFSTRKLADPRWEAPLNAKLALEIETTEALNTLAVQLKTDAWRGYSGRRPETWTALVPLAKAGRQRVELAVNAFTNASGQTLDDWYGVTELILQPGSKSEDASSKDVTSWNGEVPKFFELRWIGGEPVQRPKAYLSLELRADGGLD